MSRIDTLAKHWGKALAVALVIAAFALGYVYRGEGRSHEAASSGARPDGTQHEAQQWTCSMHPQIRQPKPGQCPICAMDLIPVRSGARGGDEEAPRALTLSTRARKLAEIETAPVERKFVSAEIRMVGKVDYDETRVGHITAWVPGRIDHLYVDYTGVRVNGQEILRKTIGPETATLGWLDVRVDLSEYAGRSAKIELLNEPTGWRYEAAHWGEITL